MKKRVLLVFMLLMLCGAFALAETVVFEGVSIDTQAQKIDFGKHKVRDIDALCALIDQMPNLTQVDMYATTTKRSETDMLFDRYPNIFFGWTFKVGDHIVRSDQTAFSTLHNSSPKPPHKSRDFEKLRYCKNILAIDIGHNWVDDISFLRNFPQLKVLILGQNRVEDLTPLMDLKELEYLELFTNHARDYTPLAALTSLRDLNVKNNPCKDLTPLHALTQLERFWAGCYVNIPKEQMEAMEQAVPDCEYNWTSMPTAGTWRKHPRYFVIREMFQRGVYIPFED